MAKDPASAVVKKRNSDWSRDELILALDLYLRFRESPPGKNSGEVAELSAMLNALGKESGGDETFRNANGVYMKMMNFRRFDPEYTADGKVGLTRGNKNEKVVWDEFSSDAKKLADEVAAIRAGSPPPETPYWVFVCNPKKWAIDDFLTQKIEHDTWGVRPSDRHRFAPGQLGIVRVGVDQRSKKARNGKPPLQAGIYALCEVESEAFEGTGANDEHWADGEGREPGWPTVKIRYLQTYADKPLSIDMLSAARPETSKLLLKGFQAASFPIPASDFHAVMELLGEDLDELPAPPQQFDTTSAALAAMEKKYRNASPEVKERISKYIERGSIGALVKKKTEFKCQVCEALGRDPLGFKKKNGQHYIEAHHVKAVSGKEVGSLGASNVMTVCANHHRQLHYGGINVAIGEENFEFVIETKPVKIPRLKITLESGASAKQ